MAIAVQTGDAQFAGTLPAAQAEQLRKVNGIQILETASSLQYYVNLNNSKKPFDDKRVRQALNYGVNKDDVLKVADLGQGKITDSPVAADGVWGYTKINAYAYDPNKAKDLLTQAGYPNGFKTTLWTTVTSKDRAVAIQAQLQKIGVTVDVVQMEAAALTAEEAKPVNQSQIQMLLSGWSPSTGDADWALRPLYTKALWPPAGPNYSFYTDPEVETDVTAGLQFTEPAKRSDTYAKAQQLIMDDAPSIFLYAPTYFSAVRANIGGITVQNDGMVYMRTVYVKK